MYYDGDDDDDDDDVCMYVCMYYRNITILSSAGKILAGILLSRLNAEIVKTIIPESQCRFRQNRGKTDRIFMARQIQEKCS